MTRFRFMILTLSVCLLLSMAAHASASVTFNQWSSSGPFKTGLGNRVITALAVSPDNKTVYAGTGSGSVYRYSYSPPTVTTNAATGVTSSGATLNGTANANFDDAAVSFEYITNSTLAATPATVSGGTDTSFSGILTGLLPNTLYEFWAVATNNGGTTYGSHLTFITKKTQSITFGSAPTILKDGTEDVSATATSGLTVTFTSQTPSECTVSGTAVTGTTVGTNNCIIAANQTGDSTNDAALQVTQTFSILQPRTITATIVGTGGSITPGTVTIADGTTKQFTITPNANYRVLTPLTTTCPAASLTGSPTTSMIFTTAAITADCSVTPLFISTANGSTYTVTISSDPTSTSGGWSGTTPDIWTPSGAGAKIPAAEIKTRLDAGTSVIVTTNAGAGAETGDILVKEAISWSGNSTLTLYAKNNLTVGADITASGNTAGLQLTSNVGAGSGSYNLDNAAVVTLSGTSPSLYIDGNSYTVIKDATGLQGISGNLAGRYALGTDIADVAATITNFVPLGGFSGTFDGLGHTIGNLVISRSSTDNVGLFGSTSNATLRNVGFVGGTVTGRTNVGTLTGSKNGGSITNAYNRNIAVIGSDSTGGLVGYQASGSISNSYNSGTVNGVNAVGGLVAYSQGTITNSFNSGNVTGNINVGGAVGLLSLGAANLNYVYSSGIVSGNMNVGGLVGGNVNGLINSSYWDKTVNSSPTFNSLGTGKTTAEMKQIGTYSDWAIASTGGSSNTWRIYDTYSYPLLRKMLKPLTATAATSATKTYDGNPYADAAGTVYTPAGYDDAKLLGKTGYSFSPVGGTNVGSYTMTPAVYSTANGYDITAVNGGLTISQASSATTITCPASATYSGSALTPCTVSVTGANLNLAPAATYANNTNVGTASADYTYAGDSNHSGSIATQKTFTIDKASSTSAISCPASATYTGLALTPCTVLVTGANLSLTPAATYANNTNVGSASADYTYAGDSNHTGSTATTKNFTIDKASSTTTVTCTAGPFTYTGSALTPCTTAVTGLGGLSLTPVPDYANNINAGTATASYSYTGDSNHSGSSGAKNFIIEKAISTTTVICPASVTYSGLAQTPCSATVTGTGGLNLAPVPAYANNTNAGTATASYSYTGDNNHSGSIGAKSFIIDKAMVGVIIDNLFATWDGSPKSAIARTTPPGLAVNLTYDGSATAPANAGSCTVVGTISDSNYQGTASGTLTIAKTTQAVTLATTATKTYGDADFGIGAGVLSGLQLTYSSSNEAVATVSAAGLVHIVSEGSVTITASQAGDGNHEAAAAAQQAVIINKAPLTVTADNSSRAYGAANPDFTATISGFVFGENGTVITGAPTFTTTATTASPEGSYPVTPVVIGLNAANYSFTPVNGTMAIGLESQSISFTPLAAKTYGDSSFSLTATGGASGNVVTFSSSNTDVATISGTTVTIVGAGVTIITAEQLGASGKFASATAQQQLTVAKATITVIADSKSRSYDTTNPPLTASYSGFVRNEDATVVAGAPALATSATQASPVGSYPLTVSQGTLVAANYTFAFVPGTLAVGLASQTITFTELAARTYGDAPFELSASGGPSTSPLSFTSSNPAVATISGDIVTIIGAGSAVITASQPGDNNYASATAQQNLTVNKALLTVTADNVSRVYGGAEPTVTASYSGFVSSDTISVLQGAPSLSSSATIESVPGSYPITAAAGNLFSNNYRFIYADGTLTIDKATLTVTADNQTKGYGAAIPILTATFSGFRNGDSVAKVTGTPSLATTASVTSPVGSYHITVDVGTLTANNYNFAFNNGTLTVSYSSTSPVIMLSTLADGGISSTGIINVSGFVTAINGLQTLTLNNTPVIVASNGSFSYPLSLLPGANTLTVVAFDNANLTTTVSRTIFLDASAPIIRLTSDLTDNSVTRTAEIIVSGNVYQAGATVSISLNGTAQQGATMTGSGFNLPATLVPGLNTIEIIATDPSGKVASSKLTITLNSAISLAVTTPGHDSKIDATPFTLAGRVDGTPPLTVAVAMDGQVFYPEISNGRFSQTLTFTTEKSYPVSVTANDTDGNSVTVIRNINFVLLGDFDANDRIDLIDALKAYYISQGLAQPTATDLLRCDVAPLDADGRPQGDGIINLGDVMILLRYVIGVKSW